MLDVLLCIEKRKKYPCRGIRNDEWLTEINSMETLDEIFFVVPESFLVISDSKQRKEFETRYSIAGVFDLGQPYISTGIHMVLVQAVPYPVNSIKMSIFKGKVVDNWTKKPNKGDDFVVPTKYTDKFNEYIKGLETWINEGIIRDYDPQGQYEYTEVSMAVVDTQKLYPKYYSKQALEVRHLLEREEHVVRLSDVADVVVSAMIPPSRKNGEEMVKTLRTKDMRYPLYVDDLELGAPTNIVLQKKDIVFPKHGNAKPYLFNSDTEEKIYASPNMVVIKCRDILLPEYLYLYLISDTAVCILESISTGEVIRNISVNDLVSLPIVLPPLHEQHYRAEKYRTDFEILSSGNIRKYRKVGEIQSTKESADNIEDVLNIEIDSKIKIYTNKQLEELLENDIKELNICFKGGAYKATLILAGSILEAVLLDWLSEKDGINYFKETYKITFQKDGKERERNANLADYINVINEIEHPNWMTTAEHAHKIRASRNLVHAKLCLKSSNNIDEKLCKEVIHYLEEVLETRGVGQIEEH